MTKLYGDHKGVESFLILLPTCRKKPYSRLGLEFHLIRILRAKMETSSDIKNFRGHFVNEAETKVLESSSPHRNDSEDADVSALPVHLSKKHFELLVDSSLLVKIGHGQAHALT